MTENTRSSELDEMNKPCTRKFNDGGAYTVVVKDGEFYCPSCNRPTKEHK